MNHSTFIKQRGFLILGILALIWLFQWAYVNWLSQAFDYYGFQYYPPPGKYLFLAWTCGTVPAFWMPLRITRPSQLAYWVLYLTVIVPSMFIPFFVALNEASEVAWLTVSLWAGFALTGLGYLFPLRRFKPSAFGKLTFWVGFSMLAAACALWVAVAFRGNIRLVSFSEIYELRDAATDLTPGTNYSLMWLYGAINPFLIAFGLYSKRVWAFVAGALGQLLVYSSFGTKASLLSVLFILGIYLLFRVGRNPFGIKFTWTIVVLFALLCGPLAFSSDEPGLSLFSMLFLIFFRTFGLAGLLTAQYYNFFQHNPHTFYAHIKGFTWLFDYPFHYPLGSELGYYYYNSLVDTTAHFWATDGIAAIGLPGILLASLACALVFWLIDSVSQRHNPEFAAMTIFYATYSLANLSLFTTLLSGGLGLLILFLYVMPPASSTNYLAQPAANREICLPQSLGGGMPSA